MPEGVIFCTYAALISHSQHGTRLQQIIAHLGGRGAQGCVLFDESHKAKNLVPHDDKAQEAADAADAADASAATAAAAAAAGGGFRSKPTRKKVKKPGESSKTAAAVSELQRACPSARVVYCSATGASAVSQMAYMERLGLWGTGTAFANFEDFKTCICGRNVGAMELVALDMKRRGMYISRQLSFKSAELYDDRRPDAAAKGDVRRGERLLVGAALLLLVRDERRAQPRAVLVQEPRAPQRPGHRQDAGAPVGARDDALLGVRETS